MILAAALAAPALAQPVSGAEKVGFALRRALPSQPAQRAGERSVTELLAQRGFHVLLSDRCRGAHIHSALDWLAARPEVDRHRIVVLGWSDGGNALLAALKHRIGPMPLQARAAIALSPSCGPYAVTPGSYLPVAPLLILEFLR